MEEKVILSGKEYIVVDETYYPVIKENHHEEMGGGYWIEKMEGGEQVLIPAIKMPKMIDERALRMFGKARLKFLKENKIEDYEQMLLEGTLQEHLDKIEDQAIEFITKEKPKMMEPWGLTKELQSEDFLKYAGLMKNLDMTLDRMAMEQIIWV
ncbi:TnpV protein [Criibacterium bergeronii]|uniref:TnpV protein n=2 Tax=Criibacterium bergeronii TaxID=1871336 RepID=A0A552UVP4_9FIRM|nr:TnpV protein [Criibacterium bergeronii]